MHTNSSNTPAPDDADLQALADEIAATTGVSPATAHAMPPARGAPQQWDAAITHMRRQARRRTALPESLDKPDSAACWDGARVFLGHAFAFLVWVCSLNGMRPAAPESPQ